MTQDNLITDDMSSFRKSKKINKIRLKILQDDLEMKVKDNYNNKFFDNKVIYKLTKDQAAMSITKWAR